MDKDIKLLAVIRAQYFKVHQARRIREGEILTKDAQYIELCQLEDRLNERIITLQDEIKDKAVWIFSETQDKNPLDGVKIVMKKRVTYDSSEAVKYCLQYLQEAIELKKSVFESHMKKSPTSFVTISQEPVAQIATDLMKLFNEGVIMEENKSKDKEVD
ncbi:MAG: hypothetical protein HXS54_06125 [Theionarchaea archaeon]|nr:hypothetical protein [Theionarchaea archaeon]DBA34836.1 TPA_asm: hypothetical protein vir521_00042 [Caudoviricetes sp. vir521]